MRAYQIRTIKVLKL